MEGKVPDFYEDPVEKAQTEMIKSVQESNVKHHDDIFKSFAWATYHMGSLKDAQNSVEDSSPTDIEEVQHSLYRLEHIGFQILEQLRKLNERN